MKCLINDEMDCINEKINDETECLICQYFLETLKEFENKKNKENNKTTDKNENSKTKW